MTNALIAASVIGLASTNWVSPVVTEVNESSRIVTNVVETDNASGCDICKGGFTHLVYGLEACKPYVAPTERTKTVTVTKIHTLTFKWLKKKWTCTDKKVLFKNVTKHRRKDTWEKVQE